MRMDEHNYNSQELIMVQRGMRGFFGKHVLLLQGPLGPFFNRLSRDLSANGARVSKINFNGGDWLFYPRGAVAYRGRMEDWPEYFSKLLLEWNVDVVLLYGDCRPVHQCVRKRAHELGVEVGVFEAGYLRPNYITLEQSGINGYSRLPRDEKFYLELPEKKNKVPFPVGKVFWHAALWAVLYYLASSLLRLWFKHYKHHRRLAIREAWPWLRGLWRKFYYSIKERHVRRQLESHYTHPFFLVPLQVHYDSQMHVHSDYADVDSFIESVVGDFAKNAPCDTHLVIKHHPMDRAYRDYTRLCMQLADTYGLQGRLLYVHDLHLPSVYRQVKGLVVVNSTVGLSALLSGTPVKVCGRAIYDISGLTFTGVLGDFWREASTYKVNVQALRGFRWYLIEHTQINGSVYRRLAMSQSHSGLIWDQQIELETSGDIQLIANQLEDDSQMNVDSCASMRLVP